MSIANFLQYKYLLSGTMNRAPMASQFHIISHHIACLQLTFFNLHYNNFLLYGTYSMRDLILHLSELKSNTRLKWCFRMFLLAVSSFDAF